LEKSDFSNLGAKEIRFFGKIGFLKPGLLKKSDVLGRSGCWNLGAKEIRFFGKIGFLKPGR
jgi:hypothetical protein